MMSWGVKFIILVLFFFVWSVNLGNVALVFATATPTPTPKPTPTLATPVLAPPVVSGSTVTFNWSPGVSNFTGWALVVRCVPISLAVAFDSGNLAAGATTVTWRNAPANNYQADLTFGGVSVSGPQFFSVSGTAAGPCVSTTPTPTVPGYGTPVYSTPPAGSDPLQICDLNNYFESLVKILTVLAGFAFFVMIVAGGYRYLTSSGDPKGADAARKTITFAIIGLILLVLSWIILLFIQNISGANPDLTIFNICPWPA